MNYLIDTHLLLWAAGDTKRLTDTARRILEAETSTLWFSAAAIWEIAIKKSLGRGDFQVEPRRLRGGLLGNGWRDSRFPESMPSPRCRFLGRIRTRSIEFWLRRPNAKD